MDSPTTSNSGFEDYDEFSRLSLADEPRISTTQYFENQSEEDNDGAKDQSKHAQPVAARAYQLEMLEASLRENIICAMDTGSGKTQVAVLRMKAELEKLSDGRVIWFLAPTVELCSQQYRVVEAQLPSTQAKLITGSERVDVWSSSTWASALINVKIIITTPQVLLDALLNAFVRIPSLALLVFDEAHRCTRNHPYRRIMKEFYWEFKLKGEPVPHILALTASPVTSSDVSTVSTLEATLNAVCRSPTTHREELLIHSHRPSLITVTFKAEARLAQENYSVSMQKLIAARNNLNIMEDPYVQYLATQKTESSYRKLEKAVFKRRTYVQDTMRSFCRRSIEMALELGRWAADWYIYKAIQHFLKRIVRHGASSESFRDSEVVYLARIFQEADIGPPQPMSTHSQLSDKVQLLIEALLKYDEDTKAICFVKERSTTVVLEHILTSHTEVSNRFKIGFIVGTSFVPGVKQDFLDLLDTGAQTALKDFRTGAKNLLVSTSVLEEGIDVPACNLVICFHQPSELRSFIQRRGRARMRDSHYYIFVNSDDVASSASWEELEAQMKRQYEEGIRKIKSLEALDDPRDLDYPEIRVENTGARLTIHDAKSRLHQFVATLTSKRYIDSQPEYLIEATETGSRPCQPPRLRATVLLPISVPQNIRRITGLRMWTSEKIACMDAAFQAYQALWKAGLIDDHLMPLRARLEREIETRPGIMQVRPLYNPWLSMAKAKNDGSTVSSRRTLRMLRNNGTTFLNFELTVPGDLPEVEPLVAWWDHDTHYTLYIDSDVMMPKFGDEASDHSTALLDHTSILLALAYCHRRMEIRDDCILRLAAKSTNLYMHQLGETDFIPGLVPASGFEYLVRDQIHEQHPYYFHSFLPCKPSKDSVQKSYKGFEDDPVDAAYLSLHKWPRQAGYFHRPIPPPHSPSEKPYCRVLLASNTKVDSIPLAYAELGLLIPSLIHHIGLYLVAAELSSTILAPLEISNVSMIVEAICATGARTPTNYERFEFLGDSILKTCITVNVAATNLHHAEGILSLLKDRMVSNARLCRAACDSGLDQFIVTQALVTKRWRPPYLFDLIDPSRKPEPARIMASKTLADVVEALVGLCFIEGGLAKAVDCVQLFVPESKAKSFQQVRDILAAAAKPKGMELPADLQPLEELIGYQFAEKALLVEAVTHPSYNLSNAVACFERLEFIGDAILDYVVVRELSKVQPALENWQMHLLRTALVNADILAFFTMEWSYRELRFDVCIGGTTTDGGDEASGRQPRMGSPSLVEKQVSIPLWSFMRQSSPELVMERELTRARHEALRESILEAMHFGTHYPWALFARLHAQKFYSDFFEALVGAVWVDSGPGFEACQEFLTRSGLLPYLRRLLQDNVHALHPKEELGRLAGNETTEYVVRKEEGSVGGAEWACQVKVGRRLVAEETGCLFKEEARVKAAMRACEILKIS